MHRLVTLFTAAAALAASGTAALAGGIAVAMDHARMVTFDQPVATVYVGNPAIADITVVDSRRVFVLGKAFGATNIIALDANGKELFDKSLTVLANTANVVTVTRGASQMTYACAGVRCEPAPVPGDASSFYQGVMAQNAQRESMGQQSAANSK